ncbi:hypothetical protein HAX54_023172 [Datura stramonium]|uniref:Uncharacterized protein n=1 Tax=Datura stramonium TaxID=4076 RepID=A0ABS8UYA7_DATST|nr:hypothetical protein [Datura stramonium]
MEKIKSIRGIESRNEYQVSEDNQRNHSATHGHTFYGFYNNQNLALEDNRRHHFIKPPIQLKESLQLTPKDNRRHHFTNLRRQPEASLYQAPEDNRRHYYN